MKKFATSAIVADLDNLAELFQNAGTELGIPQRIAMDFAYRCDLLSDAIEKLAGEEEAEEEEAEEEEAEEKESSKKATLNELKTLINRLAGDEEAEEEEAEEEEAEEAELEKKAFRALQTLKKLAEEAEEEEAEEEEAEEEEAEEKESSKKARDLAKRQALATLLRIAEEEEAEEEEAEEEEAGKKASGEEKEIGQQDDQTIEKDSDEPYMDGFKEGWKEVKEKTGKSASKYRRRFSK